MREKVRDKDRINQITPEQLWETVTIDIPALKPFIENVQKTLS